jgi:hypothetical protein
MSMVFWVCLAFIITDMLVIDFAAFAALTDPRISG